MVAGAVVLGLVWAPNADARRRRKPKRAPAHKVVPKPAPVEPASPEPASPAPDPAATPVPEVVAPRPVPRRRARPRSEQAMSAPQIMDALSKAQDACEAFDLETCITMCLALVDEPEINSEQEATVYAHLAASYAVLGDPTESERYYRLLLRLKPEFDLGAETPPKILVVFKNVQSEEKRLREAMKEAEKKRLKEGIAVEVTAPEEGRGGRPLTIEAHVTSKMGGISGVSLKYRREEAEDFATQPMAPAGTDQFKVTFPPTQTAADADRTWQYFVVVEGEANEVLRIHGNADQPLSLPVGAGSIPGTPLWRQPAFWLISTPPVAGALLAAGLLTAGAVGSSVVALWLYSIQPPQGQAGTQRL